MFIYSFLAVLGLLGCAFSSCSERVLLSVAGSGFSLQRRLFLHSTGFRRVGFSSGGSWASTAMAHGLYRASSEVVARGPSCS